MRVNTVTMFLVGTVVWVAALVVVLVLQAAGHDLDGAVQICLTGIGIGLLGLGWAVPHERRAARRREPCDGAAGGARRTEEDAR